MAQIIDPVPDQAPDRAIRKIANESYKKREHGFALTEAMLALSVLALILMAGLTLAYFSVSMVWIEKASYEASICAASRGELHLCRTALRRSIEGALPIGIIEGLDVERGTNFVRTRVRFRLHSSLDPIDHHDERRLPLTGGLAATHKTTKSTRRRK